MVRQYGLFISVMYGAMFIADIHYFAKLNILNELTKKERLICDMFSEFCTAILKLIRFSYEVKTRGDVADFGRMS